MTLKKKVFLFALTYLFGAFVQLNAQSNLPENWVDSVFHSMTLDEKIGQMLMIRAFSKDDKAEHERIKKLIKEEHVGGICFFQGTPEKQVELTNMYQNVSKHPLFISIDGEWGLGMRHPKYTISYPRQLMLGAVQDNNLIYRMGKDIASQCLRMGININFAPVVDVNNNVLNPVINDRSFGEDKINVAAKAYAYMQGLQEGGVLASAKHFPGHGDTETDSHYDLPIINHGLERLNDVELFPFKSLINLGIGSIMVAHLHIPALDARENRATTLSKATVTNLLREQLGFKGIIFTDAMEMKGVTKHFDPGEADAEAVMAGNDIVLLPLDVKKAKASIKKYLDEGKISIQQINASVLRILNAKKNYHISNYNNLSLDKLDEALNKKEYTSLRSELVENALTLVSNDEKLVPIKDVNQKLMTISIGSNSKNSFQHRIDDYSNCQHLNLPKELTSDEIAKTIYKTKSKDLVIITLHDMSKSAKNNYGLSNSVLQLINKLNEAKNVILVVFGSPYALKNFDYLPNVVVSYEDTEMTQDITAQSLFGANPFLGKLPVTASEKYYVGKGITTPSLGRLGFSLPERVGMSTDKLNLIEKTVDTIIETRAAPGCQILIARKGKIVYHHSFGHFKYNGLKAVENSDIYDLASVTKVMASTLAVMKLTDESKLDIDLPLNTYLPQADTSNKKDITISQMMAHHGKLKPWIPFYASTVEKVRRKSKLLKRYYSNRLRDSFEIPVAENLFLRSDYRDTIWSEILGSELRETDDYRYSDLGFYLTGFCVENKCLTSLDRYVDYEFYKPLGLRRTLFNPLSRVPKEEIAPTEKDDYFRNQLLQGEVHDMGAAMLGGVSGHAGLFSNSYELSILSQMLLNGGTYGGKTFLKPQTIDKFTKRFYKSTRRGIGFDMKELDKNEKENLSPLASDKTYGHYGFTGTAVFIDPVNDLIYIFLSNRTFPTMTNNKLNKYNYRSKIQTLAYEAITE